MFVNPSCLKIHPLPIYGMPILEIELAKNIVNKRSMKPVAGIEMNYSTDQNRPDAFRRCQKVLQDLISEIKISKIFIHSY